MSLHHLQLEIYTKFQSDWAEAKEARDPNAPFCTFATVDENGFPRCRIVGLREIDVDKGTFLVFGNATSPKLRDLGATSKFELVVFWTKPKMIQYRISGDAWKRLDEDDMKERWKTKPKKSQLLDYYYAHKQPQSSVLEGGRTEFVEAMGQLQKEFAGKDVPVQTTNTGLVLSPSKIEQWRADLVDRLHERHVYQKKSGSQDSEWEKQVLVP